MSRMSEIDQDLQDIDEKIDEIDAILGDLPLRKDKIKRLSSMLYQFYAELEEELEVMSSDWEA